MHVVNHMAAGKGRYFPVCIKPTPVFPIQTFFIARRAYQLWVRWVRPLMCSTTLAILQLYFRRSVSFTIIKTLTLCSSPVSCCPDSLVSNYINIPSSCVPWLEWSGMSSHELRKWLIDMNLLSDTCIDIPVHTGLLKKLGKITYRS